MHESPSAVLRSVSTPSFLDNKQYADFENVFFVLLHILYDFFSFIKNKSKRKSKLDQEVFFYRMHISKEMELSPVYLGFSYYF